MVEAAASTIANLLGRSGLPTGRKFLKFDARRSASDLLCGESNQRAGS